VSDCDGGQTDGRIVAHCSQAAQELTPERLGLAVADRHAEDFAAAVGVDRHRDDHRRRDDAMIAPGLQLLHHGRGHDRSE